MQNQHYIFEYNKSFFDILEAENSPYYQVFIGSLLVLLTINFLLFTLKSAFATIVVYLFLTIFFETLFLARAIPKYITMRKYHKLEIFIDKVIINDVEYSMNDITYKTFIFYTRFGGCIKELTIFKNKKKIGKFYFEINNLKLFPMDLEIIEKMLSNFKNNMIHDYQINILNNIFNKHMEQKRETKDGKYINFLAGFAILLPVIAVVIFIYMLQQ